MLDHVSPQRAADLLLSLDVHRETEAVSLYSALGRVCAETLTAAFSVPPFRKSPFDGYAIRSADSPGWLHVSRTVAAGGAADFTLGSGEAVRIFTGSPVPESADAVIKQEDVSDAGEFITVPERLTPGTNVIGVGEDYLRGAELIKAGTVLDYAQLGVLASQGYGSIPVYKRPRVSLISTGSELVEPGAKRGTYTIYNSSAAAICGWLRAQGLEAEYKGIVRDDRAAIEAKVRECLTCSDVVITTGGASVGDYDFALDTAKAVGAESLFWKVNMKPGGAILASVKDGKLLLSLSGNPAAALMGLIVVARPYLKKLCGQSDTAPKYIRLPLKDALPKTSSVIRLLRGHLEIVDGAAMFCEHRGRGNGNLSSFEDCNLIGFIPPGDTMPAAGTIIDALWV